MKSTKTTQATASTSAAAINKSNKIQINHLVFIENYCNSILMQPNIDLSAYPSLTPLQGTLNNTLATAQSHATFFNDTVKKSIIQNMMNIQTYYLQHQSLESLLPNGATNEQWIKQIGNLFISAQGYLSEATKTVKLLNEFWEEVSNDEVAFQNVTDTINADLNEDNLALKNLKRTIGSIDSEIQALNAAQDCADATLGLGVLMIGVGGIEDFVTAGTTTPLVVGGVAMAVGSAATIVGTGEKINALYKQKRSDIKDEKKLQNEIKLLVGICTTFTNYSNTLQKVANDTLLLENSWNGLEGVLSNLISDLTNGMNTEDARKTFLLEAQEEVKQILEDIKNINHRLDHQISVKPQKNQTVDEAFLQAANNLSNLN